MGGSTVRGRHHETIVVALEPDTLPQGIATLRWHLGGLLTQGQTTLVVDVSALDRLSSATVAALLWAKRGCATRAVRLVVRGPTRRSLDVLTRTGLTGVLEIEPAPAQHKPLETP